MKFVGLMIVLVMQFVSSKLLMTFLPDFKINVAIYEITKEVPCSETSLCLVHFQENFIG